MNRSGTKFIANADCDCGQTRLTELSGRILVVCPCRPARYLNDNGTYESLEIFNETDSIQTDIERFCT